MALGIKSPLIGTGFESYGWNNEKFLKPLGIGTQFHMAHNQIMQVFSGQGIPGVLIYLLLIIYSIKNLIIRGDDFFYKQKLPFLSGLMGVFIYTNFQEWFYIKPVYLIFWILLMISFTLKEKKSIHNAQ